MYSYRLESSNRLKGFWVIITLDGDDGERLDLYRLEQFYRSDERAHAAGESEARMRSNS